MLWLEVLLVLVLIVLNGALALSELAIVSSRRPRLETMVAAGDRGAAIALNLAENPGRFLSAVQIGITLVGILAGAFGGATITEQLAAKLAQAGLAAELAEPMAFVGVVVVVTYLSLILGELVPKQVALRNPERAAALVAKPMSVLARVANPLVWLLDASSRLCLRILGQGGRTERRVTEEEIRTLVAEAASAGVVEPAEHAMISGVMRLGDRPIRAVMTHRLDVEWIDLDTSEAERRAILLRCRHSRLPVARGAVDDVLGIVRTKDLLDACLEGRAIPWEALIRPVPVVHENADLLDAIEILKAAKAHMTLVVDEYGTFEGLLTTADILAAIAGRIRAADGGMAARAVKRQDGSWLIDGAMAVDEMADALMVTAPRPRDYETAAGLALAELRHLPNVGESFVWRGWRFEIVDMDGRRIDKLLAARLES